MLRQEREKNIYRKLCICILKLNLAQVRCSVENAAVLDTWESVGIVYLFVCLLFLACEYAFCFCFVPSSYLGQCYCLSSCFLFFWCVLLLLLVFRGQKNCY